MREGYFYCWRVQTAYNLSDLQLNELLLYLTDSSSIIIPPIWLTANETILRWTDAKHFQHIKLYHLGDVDKLATVISKAYATFWGSGSILYSAIEKLEEAIYEGETLQRRIVTLPSGEELTRPVAATVFQDDKCSYLEWKDGLILPMLKDSLLLPAKEAIQYCENMGSFPLVKEVRGITRKIVDSIMEEKPEASTSNNTIETRETFLSEVFKWHIEEPDNKAIHVGLLKLQGKTNQEIYRTVWKCYNEDLPESYKSSVNYQKGKFKSIAMRKGISPDKLKTSLPS